MGDVDVPVVGGDLSDPAFDFRPFDFHGSSAVPTHQVVMVVLGVTQAIASLAVVASHDIDGAGLSQRSELVVDGRESDILTSVPQLGKQLLRRPEPVRSA